jgi:hypothetical protein
MKSCIWILIVVLFVTVAGAAEQQRLSESSLGEQLRRLDAANEPADRLNRATDLAARHALSSQQVKTIAARLPDDSARLEFATAAFPRVVDPENFYEVYDAFTTFSKVMRLHDRIRRLERMPTAPVVLPPPTIAPEEMKDIIAALKRESFDQTRTKVARQILSSSSRKFLSEQVRDMVRCFDFEPSRLELAKYAYQFTFDKEKYFLVNEAFDFDNSKRTLAQYIEGWRPGTQK